MDEPDGQDFRGPRILLRKQESTDPAPKAFTLPGRERVGERIATFRATRNWARVRGMGARVNMPAVIESVHIIDMGEITDVDVQGGRGHRQP